MNLWYANKCTTKTNQPQPTHPELAILKSPKQMSWGFMWKIRKRKNQQAIFSSYLPSCKVLCLLRKNYLQNIAIPITVNFTATTEFTSIWGNQISEIQNLVNSQSSITQNQHKILTNNHNSSTIIEPIHCKTIHLEGSEDNSFQYKDLIIHEPLTYLLFYYSWIRMRSRSDVISKIKFKYHDSSPFLL